MSMSEDQRTPRADEIQITATIGVKHVLAGPADYEERRPTDGAKRPHR
jgi:hypothetical protein